MPGPGAYWFGKEEMEAVMEVAGWGINIDSTDAKIQIAASQFIDASNS